MASKNWWWGRSASVDLHNCDPELVKNPEEIKKFVKELTKVLKMKRVGPTEVKRFGHGQLRGYSMMQFIETSTIVAHFDEKANRAFIDVFSCKKYNANTVAKFCKNFFKAKSYSLYVEERK
ncbi:MAG: S-adenosylmethionine decarboxylase [Nanoarchaeota archaeon]|nr:S-adenosylmethionine decarboxylase [Nanoarchaeota archaeon]MBU1631830.1 S-adenosylmethionine decarboxylase [Nanoarchaeota archaeon]MBU1876103.1 S-adenosylmethionine decarboxylase [Nanoarchaeota archaeon]